MQQAHAQALNIVGAQAQSNVCAIGANHSLEFKVHQYFHIQFKSMLTWTGTERVFGVLKEVRQNLM